MSENWIQKLIDRLEDGTEKIIILTREECQALHAALVRGEAAAKQLNGNIHGHEEAFLWGRREGSK